MVNMKKKPLHYTKYVLYDFICAKKNKFVTLLNTYLKTINIDTQKI